MKIYIRPRAGGKTTWIIKQLIEDPAAVVIVPHHQMGERIVEKIVVRTGCTTEEAWRQVITSTEIKTVHPLNRQRISKLYIEELDHVLADLLGARSIPLEAATLTGEIDVDMTPASDRIISA